MQKCKSEQKKEAKSINQMRGKNLHPIDTLKFYFEACRFCHKKTID